MKAIYQLNEFDQFIVLTLCKFNQNLNLNKLLIRHRAIVKILHLSQLVGLVGCCFDSISRNLNRGGYS